MSVLANLKPFNPPIETIAELKRLYAEGNSIKALAEYYDWSQWTVAELLEVQLT